MSKLRCVRIGLPLHGGEPEVLASASIQNANTIKLRVNAADAVCSFAFSTDGQEWKTLVKDADAKILTTEVAGGFVGATVGLHARL